MPYLMCALMLSATLEAAAQESAGAVYVNAGVSFPHQAALEVGSTCGQYGDWEFNQRLRCMSGTAATTN